MHPTLKHGDWLFLQKTKPQKGDIVIIKHHLGILVKRVAYVPGEEVEILFRPFLEPTEQFSFSIPSKDEPINHASYWKYQLIEDFNTQLENQLTIPELEKRDNLKTIDNYYFVLGDNILESVDSRDLGLIKESDILGTVIKLSFY